MRPEAESEVSKKMALPTAALASSAAAGPAQTATKIVRRAKQVTTPVARRIFNFRIRVSARGMRTLSANCGTGASPLVSRLRLPPRVPTRPPHHPLAGLEEMGELGDKAHRSHQRERADVRVWQSFVQAGCGCQNGSATCNHVINENHALGQRLCPTHDRQRIHVLSNSWAISTRGRRGFTNGVVAAQAQPDRRPQSHAT